MSSALTVYRMGTANTYDNARLNVGQRQTQLANLQENLTSGKRVVRPSDDPVAAAQAERAMTRINRIQTEQRSLELQRNAMAQAESTLGDVVGLVQEMRQTIIAAGSGTLKPEDRKTYANQLQSLQEQLRDVVNRKDTNGVPLLGALSSAITPFLGPLSGMPDYQFNGQPGQYASTGTSVPLTVDGHSALMFDPRRDGVYNAAISNTNVVPPLTPLDGRHFGTDTVVVKDAYKLEQPAPPAAPYTYSVAFTGMVPNADGTYNISYDISSTNPGYTSPGPVTLNNLKADQLQTIPITIVETGGAELSFNVKATPTLPLNGNFVYSPAEGDTVTIAASPSMLSVIDAAVRDIGGAANTNAAAQAVGQALASLDRGLERVYEMRGYTGELLNRADRITGDQTNRSIQLEGDRSRAEDLDMVKGISDFQNAQTGYEAALKSYAQVQRLTLFNFIN